MRREELPPTPRAAEIPIHQIRPIAHRPTEARTQFLEKRECLPFPQIKERPARHGELVEELRDRVRALAVAVRLTRWRRRCLERVLAAHRDASL